jgi:ABC-type multidrug transport system fused ATPase/permease subunit
MEGLRSEKRITLVIIAHRLATIRSADQIIVLDSGKVVESGNHKELMHEDSWYADMVRLQSVNPL